MGRVIGEVSGIASTTAYVSILNIFLEGAGTVLVWIKEENVNDVKWRVLGSNDGTNYEVWKAEATLDKNDSAYSDPLTEPWKYMAVQIVDDVGTVHGSVKCIVTAVAGGGGGGTGTATEAKQDTVIGLLDSEVADIIADLTAIKGGGWSDETLVAIQAAIEAIVCDATAAKQDEIISYIDTEITSLLALSGTSAAYAIVNSGHGFRGTVTAVDTNKFTIPALIGLGVGAFKDAARWVAYVFRDAGDAGAAPQGEVRYVTDFNSATGEFTTEAFSVPVGVGDDIIILNPIATNAVPTADAAFNIVTRDVVGNKEDAAVDTPDNVSSILAYTKGILTLIALLDPNATILKTGTASGDGAADGSTIVSDDLTEAEDIWNGALVVITSGDYANEMRQAIDFDAATDTLTVNPAFDGQILTGVTFKIIASRTGESLINALASILASGIGTTTGDGNAGGTTLVDDQKTEVNSHWNGQSIMIMSGACDGQRGGIIGFDAGTDTFTVYPAFTEQIVTGVDYVILPTGTQLQEVTEIFPSEPQAAATITDTAGVVALPSVVLPDIAGLITKVYAGIIFFSRDNTDAEANALVGDQEIQVKENAAGGYIDAIKLKDNQLSTPAETYGYAGGVILGTINVIAEVATFDITVDFQMDLGDCDDESLILNDIQTYLKVTYLKRV